MTPDAPAGDPGVDQRAIAGIEDDDQAPGVLAQAGPGHPTETGVGRSIPPVDEKSAAAAPHGDAGEHGLGAKKKS